MGIPENLKPCKTEKVCDDADATIYPMMKHLVEVEKLSERKAGDEVEAEYDGTVTSERARQIYRHRKGGSRDPVSKPLKKHTKPEAKIHLEAFKEAIKSDAVSDKDLKPVLDLVSEKMAIDRISPKVSASVAAVHKDKTKKKGPSKAKPQKSLVERVTNSFLFAATHLDAVLGKGAKAITAKDRRMLSKEVRRALPYFLRTLLHMGVDLDNVLKEALRDFKSEVKEVQIGKNTQNYRRLEK